MIDEFNKDVQKALNSISAVAVATTPIGVRLQILISTVCEALQVPAACLLLTDELPVALKSWIAGTDEEMIQVLLEWRTQDESLNPSCQTITDAQRKKHKLIVVPLVTGDQRLGAIALATPTPEHLMQEKSSLLRILAEQIGLVLLVIKGSLSTMPMTRNDNWFTEEFLAVLAHELRAPLHAILGWASVMQHPATKQETWAHALKTIERSARAQSNTINDLLDASFCFHQESNLYKRSVSAHSMLQQVIASSLPVAEQKGISINSDIRLTNDYLMADAERLRQAFWHLLSNAIKFTPKNGHIQLLAQRAGDLLEVMLVDSGIGIAPEFMPSVFDPFRQESAHTTRKFGGLGLGLAIARHQIELHGGNIEINSAGKNQGTTVVVHLPLEASLAIKSEAHSKGLSDQPRMREQRKKTWMGSYNSGRR